MSKKVIIASKNPVKINAVKEGFKKMFPKEEFIYEGASINSGVADQPMSNEETMTGAKNRANNTKEEYPDAEYWVGIEGGCEKKGEEMEAFAWVYIKSLDLEGKARTGTFFLPKKFVELIDGGVELGEVDDIVFGGTNTKQKNGTVGTLTSDVVTRTSYYVEAVALALIPFNNSDLY